MHQHPTVLLFRVMNGKEKDSGSRMSLEKRIFLIAGHPSDLKLLRIQPAAFSVPINHIVDFLVISSKHRHTQGGLAHEHLVGDLHDFHDPILANDQNVVHIRAFLDGFVLFQTVTGKPILPIQVEGLIRNHNFGGHDSVKRS